MRILGRWHLAAQIVIAEGSHTRTRPRPRHSNSQSKSKSKSVRPASAAPAAHHRSLSMLQSWSHPQPPVSTSWPECSGMMDRLRNRSPRSPDDHRPPHTDQALIRSSGAGLSGRARCSLSCGLQCPRVIEAPRVIDAQHLTTRYGRRACEGSRQVPCGPTPINGRPLP